MHFKSTYSDYVGIASAFLCLIHCLVGPIILGAASHAHDHAHTHESSIFLAPAWDYVFLTIGFIAVWFSAKHTSVRNRKLLLWASFGCLAGSIFMEAYAEMFHYFVYASSFFLIVVHTMNIRELIIANHEA